MFIMYIDGAARNNPGPAGAGVYIRYESQNSSIDYKFSYYLGVKTNNQAEYLALLLGLMQLKKIMQAGNNISGSLIIRSDSQLLVRQVAGIYRVKNKELQNIYGKVCGELQGLNYTIEHIRREYNEVADMLANCAIDNKSIMPLDYKNIISTLL